MKKKNKCCLCGREFEGYGNDPRPVMEAFANGGWNVCCDDCNIRRVIPARMKGLHTGDIKDKKPETSLVDMAKETSKWK